MSGLCEAPKKSEKPTPSQRCEANQSESRILPKLIHERIIGGEPLPISCVPWQVGIKLDQLELLCGGSIISDQWILTSAECTRDILVDRLSVIAGTANHSEGGIIYDIDTITIHDRFNASSLDYNFALIKLIQRICFNDNVFQIRLPRCDNEINIGAGSMVLVSGWGYISADADSLEQILRFVNIPIVEQQRCIQLYKAINRTVLPSMLCAGYENGGKDGR